MALKPQDSSTSQPELLSVQPYQERLRTLLPPMSDRAIQVWHTLGSQIGWEETEVAISKIKIMRFTRLSESEVQAALDELIRLGVITRTESQQE